MGEITERRRREPRFPAVLPARLEGLSAATANVSLSGLQLACPAMNYELVAGKLRSGRVSVGVVLPDGGQVTFSAKAVYASESGDEYLIGMQLDQIHGDGERLWRGYLDALVAPDRGSGPA